MPVAYPTLKPSNRTVSQGTYPVKLFTFATGLKVARRYGTKAHSSTLDLEYDNITDANAGLFTTAFNLAFGTFDSLILSTELWDDIEEPLRSRLRSTYTWRFAQAPVVTQSPLPGYKSVRIQLEGQRDG